ncbi:MAG TPA: response regulator [Herpetosiphonaceae bacterium]|nr:response regulator [Herpetosiphonaceae bacterium]
MKPRILIVDDHPDILHLLTFIFRSAGYPVLTATRGDDALREWRAERPDLVVLDINLPGVSGDEICRRIKAESNTPVVIMTGNAVTEIQASQGAPGADLYLLKPFDVMDLLDQVPHLLATAAAAR